MVGLGGRCVRRHHGQRAVRGGSANTGGASSGGAGNGGSAGSGGSGGSGETGVRIDGRDLLVDGEPYQIRGCAGIRSRKARLTRLGSITPASQRATPALMKAAGINTIRTYEPILDNAVLDTLLAAGIRVLNSVYPYGGDAASVVTERVNAVKDHPAILGWTIGNEWNYNGLYVDLPHAEALARLNEAASLIRAARSLLTPSSASTARYLRPT